MQALCSGLGSPHTPGTPVCPDHTRCEDRRRRHRPPWRGDHLALRTRSVQEAFENSPWYIIFQNRNGRQWRRDSFSCSLYPISLHVKRELSGPPHKTSWTRVADFSLVPDTHGTDFVSSNALPLLLIPLLSYCPVWLLASQVSPSLVRDQSCPNVFHLNHQEKKNTKGWFCRYVKPQSEEARSPAHSTTLTSSPWSVGVKNSSLFLAFWIIFQLYNCKPRQVS